MKNEIDEKLGVLVEAGEITKEECVYKETQGADVRL